MLLQKNVNGRRLRCGYTTGSCAAGAAKAAARMLLSGTAAEEVTLDTPKGIPLTLSVVERELGRDFAQCGIRKDSGDDPDITNGILVCARVSLCETGIHLDGGVGVGRVTKPGLDQPVGAAAINSTPRRMIAQALEEAAWEYRYPGGFQVIISIPGGEELARRTFNPRIGIQGGLSVIGTTGIVEPMSNQALADTIRVELRQLVASGERTILITPGNYGETFAGGALSLNLNPHVSCSNFIGETLDACVEYGFEKILLVGHIGKLVKLGIGLMNTHSAFGDGRLETLMACALEAGGDLSLLQSILDCVTTDAALDRLKEAGLLEETMAILRGRIQRTLERKVPGDVTLGFVCFTNADNLAGILCQSENANELMTLWRNDR